MRRTVHARGNLVAQHGLDRQRHRHRHQPPHCRSALITPGIHRPGFMEDGAPAAFGFQGHEQNDAIGLARRIGVFL